MLTSDSPGTAAQAEPAVNARHIFPQNCLKYNSGLGLLNICFLHILIFGKKIDSSYLVKHSLQNKITNSPFNLLFRNLQYCISINTFLLALFYLYEWQEILLPLDNKDFSTISPRCEPTMQAVIFITCLFKQKNKKSQVFKFAISK